MKKLFFFAILGLSLLLTLFSCQKDECAHTSLSQKVSDPTCVEEGYTLHTCTDCGFQFQSDWVLPVGHTLSTSNVSPTCDAGGYVTKVCSTCSVTYTSDYTKALGHKLTSAVTPPTCDDTGYTLNTCSVCAWSYESDFTLPTGHSFSSETVYPTRLQSGCRTQSCACGFSYTVPFFYSDVFPGAAVDNDLVLARGIDVSEYQHIVTNNGYAPLNWTAVKAAGMDFAILKAGSTPREENGMSKGGMSPVFEMNYRDAKAAGIELGVYFYTYATTLEQLKSDARLLISWLEGKQLEYPVYFDLEDPSLETMDRATLTEFCSTFITILQENGYYGALYSNQEWLTQKLYGEDLKSAFDIWYARYPEDRYANDDPLPVWASYTWNTATYGPQLGMWQYTNYGVIDGFDARIRFDFNFAYRDYPSIMKKHGYNGYEAELED